MHYSILLTQLIQELKQIDGRKKFQKIVHILKVAGAPFGERFEYAHFGPYSATLRAEIETLCEHHYFTEHENGGSYRFARGKSFERIESESFLLNSPDWALFAKALNDKAPRELESLSTVLFLKERGYDNEELKAKFSQLKEHLTQHFEWAQAAANDIFSKQQNWTLLAKSVCPQ